MPAHLLALPMSNSSTSVGLRPSFSLPGSGKSRVYTIAKKQDREKMSGKHAAAHSKLKCSKNGSGSLIFGLR